MSKKKSNMAGRTVWFWSKAEFVRFQQAIERLVAAVADLETILQEPKRRAEASAAARKLKVAAAEARAEMERAAAPKTADGLPFPPAPEATDRGPYQ